MTTLTRPRYAPLTTEELARALRELPGWRGDTSRLERTVAPADLWAVLERVAAVEAEVDHHTVVDLDAGTVTFALWTHARGGVTATDLELARRLDAVLDGS